MVSFGLYASSRSVSVLCAWPWLRGGFVFYFFFCLAPRVAVGFGPSRPVRRRFRLSLNLVRVWRWSSAWRWFWPLAFILGFGRVQWLRFIPFLCSAPCVGRPTQRSNERQNLNPNTKRTQTLETNETAAPRRKWQSSRCKLLAFTSAPRQPSVKSGRPAGRTAVRFGKVESDPPFSQSGRT